MAEVTQPTPVNTGSSQEWPGAFNVVGKAISSLKVNLTLVGAYAVLEGLVSLGRAKVNYNELATDPQATAYSATAGLSGLVALLLLAALPKLQLACADDEQIDFGELGSVAVRRFLPALGAAIVVGLVVLVGLILLIVPGLIFLTWYIFTLFLVVDKNLGPIEAMKQSKVLAKGNAGKIWGVIGVSILLSIVAGLLVSWIPFVGPAIAALAGFVSGIMMAMLYRHLDKKVPASPAPTAPVAPAPAA